ncbi:glycosyltransferase [Dysgonomonas sp. 216]|uniref:glycosyltransferase n=1 Tax=Dysgonomonas sp. 216 TaxID=2302934 RepID=UPI0013D5B797|nr:glycosyltransferase [Dysgonomonas sp. 216]NDW18936.1 glycosyltransferase [Dysgonomonas sp. 216]
MNTQTQTPVSVAVCVMTHNHEAYIAEALDGILMQETNFPVMIYIGEDCSTDRTRTICLEYKEKHPDKITLLLQDINLGLRKNFAQTIAAGKEKYIAICEGDDYWSDSTKLQKQVDFLENNPDFAMSSHNVDMLWYGIELRKMPPLNQSVFTIENVIEYDWAIMTASILFRRNAFQTNDNFNTIYNQDYVIQLLVALHGKVGYMKDSMSVYRKHTEGMSLKFTPMFLTLSLSYLFDIFNNETGNKYKKNTYRKLLRMTKINANQAKNIGHRKHSVILYLSYILYYLHINPFRIMRKSTRLYNKKDAKF